MCKTDDKVFTCAVFEVSNNIVKIKLKKAF